MSPRLLECIDVADMLGECVLWRPEDRTVWWTDILGRRLHRLAWPSLELRTFATPERLGSFAFVEGRDDLLLAAFETGFAVFAPEDGRLVWLDRPAELGDGVRLNDGRVDPQGRFWAGSMMERPRVAGELPCGALYRVDADGNAAPVLGGLHISNSLCWSPRGDRICFADTALGELYSATFDLPSGGISQPRLLKRFEGEQPDGAITCAAGDIWLALWGGGRVARLSPRGEETFSVQVDAPLTTCPAFGGTEGNLLFVTTARDGLSDAALRAKPQSGALFVFEVDAKAWPQARARLSASALGI